MLWLRPFPLGVFAILTLSCAVGTQEDEVRQGERTALGAVLDCTAGEIVLRHADTGGVSRYPRSSVDAVSFSVPVAELERLDIHKAPEAYFELGGKWLDLPGKAPRFHGRKLLWLAMHEDPAKFYEKGLLAMLDKADSEAERTELVRLGLFFLPGSQALLSQAQKLKPAETASPTPPGRVHLAKTLKLLVAEDYAGAKPLLEAQEPVPDAQVLKAMRALTGLEPSEILKLYPRPPDACGLCKGTGQMLCNACRGTKVGRKLCPNCDGNGRVRAPEYVSKTSFCARCRNTGLIPSKYGAMGKDPCPTCTIVCPAKGCVMGKVEIPCPTCGAKGQMPCSNPRCSFKLAGTPAKVALEAKQKSDLSAFLFLLETDPGGLDQRVNLTGQSRFPLDVDFTRPYFRKQRWVAEPGL